MSFSLIQAERKEWKNWGYKEISIYWSVTGIQYRLLTGDRSNWYLKILVFENRGKPEYTQRKKTSCGVRQISQSGSRQGRKPQHMYTHEADRVRESGGSSLYMLVDSLLITTSLIRSLSCETLSLNHFINCWFFHLYQDKEDEAAPGMFVHGVATFGDLQRSVDCLQ